MVFVPQMELLCIGPCIGSVVRVNKKSIIGRLFLCMNSSSIFMKDYRFIPIYKISTIFTMNPIQ